MKLKVIRFVGSGASISLLGWLPDTPVVERRVAPSSPSETLRRSLCGSDRYELLASKKLQKADR